MDDPSWERLGNRFKINLKIIQNRCQTPPKSKSGGGWAALGGLVGWHGDALGHLGGALGRLGSAWGAVWGVLGASWSGLSAVLETFWEGLWGIFCRPGASWRVVWSVHNPILVPN